MKNIMVYLIGICGGSCSGKTTVAHRIHSQLSNYGYHLSIISQDNFYRSLLHGVDPAEYDFDSPDSIDFESIYECLQSLKNGQTAVIPQYDFTTHQRLQSTVSVKPTDIVIIEGILIFSQPQLMKIFDLKIFIKADPDTMLHRRLIRDEKERGRSAESILCQYARYVKPSYHRYVKPTQSLATIIIPNDEDNHQFTGTQIIVDYLSLYLSRKSPEH